MVVLTLAKKILVTRTVILLIETELIFVVFVGFLLAFVLASSTNLRFEAIELI
jgi:hypothetical protein